MTQKPSADIARIDDRVAEKIMTDLKAAEPSTRRRATERVIMVALSAIPWVGGVLSAAASFKLEEGNLETDRLQSRWLEEHQLKLKSLRETLSGLAARIDLLGPEIEERIESEAYFALVRGAFRTWDKAETEEKRDYAARIIANAAGTNITSDDVLRLFIDWIDSYHEMHFAVIREIYRNPRVTRLAIWKAVRGAIPREDSAEADLFRLLMRDLSTGGVIRQERETTVAGQFVRQQSRPRRRPASGVLESSFEETKPHVLTELGKQFVHYTMEDIVPRLE